MFKFKIKKNKNDDDNLIVDNINESIDDINYLNDSQVEDDVNDISLEESIDIKNNTKNINSEKRNISIILVSSISLLIIICLLLKIGISSKINNVIEPNFSKSTKNEIVLNDEKIDLKNANKKDEGYFSKIRQKIYNLKNEYQSQYSSIEKEEESSKKDTSKSESDSKDKENDTKNEIVDEDAKIDDENKNDSIDKKEDVKEDENKKEDDTNKDDTQVNNNSLDNKNGIIVNSINKYSYSDLQKLLDQSALKTDKNSSTTK